MIRSALFAAIVATIVSGCSIPVTLPGHRTCNAPYAIGYVGQKYTPRIGKIIKAKTAATYVRTITPGMMVTQEFRANRVNIDLDEKNTVTRVHCG